MKTPSVSHDCHQRQRQKTNHKKTTPATKKQPQKTRTTREVVVAHALKGAHRLEDRAVAHDDEPVFVFFVCFLFVFLLL
jgi:hypothetical protein